MKAATRKRAAEILATYLSLPCSRKEAGDQVCKQYGIARRTLSRMLAALDKDTALAELVAELRKPNIEEWTSQLSQAAATVLSSMLTSVADLDSKSAEGARAKAEIFRSITETLRTDQVARVFLSQAIQSASGRIPEAVGPRVLLVTDGDSADEDPLSEAEQASAGSVEATQQEEPANAGAGLG